MFFLTSTSEEKKNMSFKLFEFQEQIKIGTFDRGSLIGSMGKVFILLRNLKLNHLSNIETILTFYAICAS